MIMESMANYIMQILKSQVIKMWSWGFNSPKSLPNNKGLKFKVNGFKHRGWVEVIYDEGTDAFNINLLNNRNNVVKQINGAYIDNLVDIIDNAVEKTDNYEERIIAEYF
jgi:hypothetical protein